MSVELSKTKELSRPDVMFGVKRRDGTIKDSADAIATFSVAAIWIVAAFVIRANFPIHWSQGSSYIIAGAIFLVIFAIWQLGNSFDVPLHEQLRETDQKYRAWLEQELRPFLESKHSVKLTGDFFTGKLMAEKDGNLFEVKLFGVQHIPSYVNKENNTRMWSHPVIDGEVGLKRVDRPDAVSYSKI